MERFDLSPIKINHLAFKLSKSGARGHLPAYPADTWGAVCNLPGWAENRVMPMDQWRGQPAQQERGGGRPGEQECAHCLGVVGA